MTCRWQPSSARLVASSVGLQMCNRSSYHGTIQARSAKVNTSEYACVNFKTAAEKLGKPSPP
jgi:hypothetical protein